MNHRPSLFRTLATLAVSGALGLACASTSARNAAETPSAAQVSTATQVAQNNACNDWEIYFTTGSADISPETRAVERLATCIRNGDVREVSVVGSTDPLAAP